MSSTNTEILNWQDFISGWSFTCGGEAPPEGLAGSVVPAVERSSDGIFEITKISFGFSGDAPYHQQKFTAEFSFNVAGTANFYEIEVASDDNASVKLGGNVFVSSELNRSGIASSAWRDTATALPEVSGTFETVGGPYALSVTITLKRLVGAEWTLSQEWTESGPYEIKTATLSFSGNARSDTQGFSWNSPAINIDGGNWIEINVEADDEATITAGTYSKKATLHSPVEFNSGWLKNAPDTFPLSVSYRNAGGPYRLSVTVTVKRSLREVYFETELNTPDELNHVPAYDQETLTKKKKERYCFGCAEIAHVKVKSKKADKEFSELPIRCWNDAAPDKDNKFCAGTDCLPENGETMRECYLSAEFSDGEIIDVDFTVKYPTHEAAIEITEEEFVNVLRAGNTAEADISQQLIDYQGHPYHDGHYYLATVHPTDVSFAYLYFWENEYPEMKTGLFAEEGINTVHTPSAPVQLNPQNQWTDRAYFALTFSENVITNATEDENGNVGILVWVCPVKWKMSPPYAPNTSLVADGTLSDRIQTIRLRKPVSPPPLLSVLVSKQFNTGWAS